MNPVSSNSVALSLLTQSASLNQKTSGSAADTILDIVSGRRTAGSRAADEIVSTAMKAKAAEKTETTGRAVGGTVSSEIPRATTSAMSAATVNGLNYNDPLIAFAPIQASRENAEAFAKGLGQSVTEYNGQFDLKEIPSREEFMAKKDTLLANWKSNGSSEKQIAINLEYNFGEGGYERYVQRLTVQNEWTVRRAEFAESRIAGGTNLLQGVFGQAVSITKEEDGRLNLGAFEMFDGSGLKMLSYNDGVLSIFNNDGSLSRTLSGKEITV